MAQRSELVYQLHEYGLLVDTREVWLAGDISDDSAFETLSNLRLLETQNRDPILLHCISPGGDWSYGMAIYDGLRACTCPTTVLVHAHAASMSSIIPQGADLRILAPNTDVLIHYGSELIGGNTQSVISTAEWSKVCRERMLDIYAARCYRGLWFRKKKYSRDAVREWLRRQIDKKQDYWMDSREAINYGFFDAILGDKPYQTVEQLRQAKPKN